MSEGFICRNSGDGYATITFDDYLGLDHDAFTSSSRALSVARNSLASTSVGNYALFGGGYSGSYSDVVDAYNISLVRTTPTTLSQARVNLAAISIGDYALFAGGYSGSYSNVVDAYDTALTRTTPTTLSQARSNLASTSIDDYALFGGGDISYDNFSNVVDAYDTSLTRTTPTTLSVERSVLAATFVKDYNRNYALFGGGDSYSSCSDVVDAYNASLTRTTPTALSVARKVLAATSVRTYYLELTPIGRWMHEYYALFAGGLSGSTRVSTVDAYDTYLTRTTPTALSVARRDLAASPVVSYALFAGGEMYNKPHYSSTVDVYDEDFVRYSAPNLIEGREKLTSTNLGNGALFAGGDNGSTFFSTVDAYALNNTLQLYPDAKYSFNGQSERTSSTFQEITVKPPISGYIKVKTTNIS